MRPRGLFPVLSARLSILLVFAGPFRHEAGYRSGGGGIAGGVRHLLDIEEKREAVEVVLAGCYGGCTRVAFIGFPYH